MPKYSFLPFFLVFFQFKYKNPIFGVRITMSHLKSDNNKLNLTLKGNSCFVSAISKDNKRMIPIAKIQLLGNKLG